MKLLKKCPQLLMIVCCIVILTSCASKNDFAISTSTADIESKSSYETTDTTFGGGSTGKHDMGDSKEEGTGVSSNRKLIRKVTLELETLEFESLLDQLTKEIEFIGGYIENSTVSGKRYDEMSTRNATYVIRIPSNEVDSFIQTVDENTNITRKQESTEDITLEYVDTESRLKALEIQQERLLALLEKADKLEDIITLEQRLSEVRYELEGYTSTIRTFDNLVEYATITLYIDEVLRITPTEVTSVWSRMGNGLSDSIYHIYKGFINFIVWIVVNGPYIIVWGGILLLSCFIFLRVNRRVKKHRIKNIIESVIIPEESVEDSESSN